MPPKPRFHIPQTFAESLLAWNREKNRREMPWKGEKDPYKIWLSEIILQQTRVEQGLGYYQRFVKAFPTVKKLAAAPEEKVFKLWEGLGYYSRCRNLIAAAKWIVHENKNVFPDNYEAILSLKGVGPYTAAAIASFAYNLPYAVVDGNVFRVLARVGGIDKETDSTAGKKFFTELAQNLLDKKDAGVYNQAIMDFGATICKPTAPLCSDCVFRKKCFAYLNDQVAALPLKKKKIGIKKRWFSYVMLEYGNRVAIRKRAAKDIWNGLYEGWLYESKSDPGQQALLLQLQKEKLIGKKGYTVESVSEVYKQQLTHQTIQGRFYVIRIQEQPEGWEWIWVEKRKLGGYAFPRFINQFFENVNTNT
ncbi:MAG: A/G-specific adenine glycosylase [Chitinophagaceae bacterium]|nr:A/G-specific adenine glycosylase [Chitinophagaceae bacterium]